MIVIEYGPCKENTKGGGVLHNPEPRIAFYAGLRRAPAIRGELV